MKPPVIRGVYGLFNTSKDIVYVGASGDVLKRWRGHLRDLEKNRHGVSNLQSDWNLGDVFSFVLLERVSDHRRNSLPRIEDHWIHRFPFRYNTAKHIVGWPDGKHTEDARKRISIAKKKEAPNPKFRDRVPHTPETRELLSLLATGRKSSKETRALLSKKLSGLKRSPASLAKYSTAIKARWKDPVQRQRMHDGIKRAHSAPEHRKKQSENASKQWSDPEIRKRMVASMPGSLARKAVSSDLWKNPDYVKKTVASMQGKKRSVEVRERMSTAAKLAWVKRKGQL